MKGTLKMNIQNNRIENKEHEEREKTMTKLMLNQLIVIQN